MTEQPAKKKIVWLVSGFGLGLLLMGVLRAVAINSATFKSLSAYVTPGYVMITILFTILLVRAGLPLNKYGFGIRPNFTQIMFAIAAILILRIFDLVLDPLLEELFGRARNLERFADIKGSVASLTKLLVLNWTLAAFGEEFAYRIVLLRGISFIFGDTNRGTIIALALQAIMFGLIHAYQGPVGITGSAVSGLVFGTVTIAGRWSIWPAALAHGTNNTIGILALYYG